MDHPRILTRRHWIVGAAALASNVASTNASAQQTKGVGVKQETKSARMLRSQEPIPVAVLLGEGATLIDFAGPWEIFSSAAYQSAGFNVYSVAATREPIVCDNLRSFLGQKPISGLRVNPDYTFEDAPQPSVLVMGAQNGADDRKLEWIRRVARKADITGSVCTGAFLFAATGLLDGKPATTNRHAYDAFQAKYPKVKLIRGVRLVDGGDVITSTGLTAGIDLALRITERFYGREVAQRIAANEEWPSKGWMLAG